MADNVVLDPGAGGDTIAADDVSGIKYQLIQIVTGSDGSAKSLVTGSNGLPVSDAGSSLSIDDGGNVISIDDAGATISVDDGAGSLTVDGTVTIQDGGNVISIDDAGSTISVDDGGGSLTVDGTVTIQDGGNVISVDDGGSSLTIDGTVTANLAPTTSGGLSAQRTLSAASTNATSVKGSAGQVYGWYVSNSNASPRYVKLYDKASSPTVGTDTPKMTIMVPGAGGANVEFSMGIPFSSGIAFAMTTGAADSDTGAVAANEVILNLLYK